MPFLYCRHLDRRTEWRVTVADGDFTIGCSETADVAIADSTIAAKEALIARKGDRYLLQDVAEKGRVLLGGTVTRTGILKDGDRIRIGRVALVFFESSQPSARQVELDRETPPRESAMQSVDFFDDAEADPPLRRSAAAREGSPRAWIVGAFVASFVAGLAMGIVKTRPTREPAAPSTSSADTVRPERTAGAQPFDRAMKELKETLAKKEAQIDSPSNEPSALKIELTPPSSPAASRLALFRLFVDLAGRPPTRAEERECLPLDHAARWRRILDLAAREEWPVDLAAPIDVQWKAWLGRAASAAELKEAALRSTPEHPAAFWIAATEEYRQDSRRRPRSAAVRARSLIVDLLDRPPASRVEVEAVRAALDAPGGALEAARTLVYSARAGGGASGGTDSSWWEGELFRFLLRQPVDREREEVPRILDALDGSVRRGWFLLALASLEGYGTY